MAFDWSPAKAAANLAKHGVAFDAVERFEWGTALVRADVRADYGEVRLVALGTIGGRLHSLVYTIRRTAWLISLRKANDKERERHAREGDR